MKIPKCERCYEKLYAVENRRKTIGYLCSECDFIVVHHPTDYWNFMREKRRAKLNLRSISGTKPKFEFHRVHTICPDCHMTKYVVCRKIKQTKKRTALGFNPKWVCYCTKCNNKPWRQNHPKIEMVKTVPETK